MMKKYRYNKINVVMKFGIFPAFFICMLILFLSMVGFPKETPLLFLSLYLCILILIFITVAFIMNLISAEVTLDDSGIEYHSRFFKIKAPWADVESVKRKYIYSGGFPSYGPPRDLQFQLKSKKKIDVLYFVLKTTNENWDEDGVPEFEDDVKTYLGDVIVDT